MKSDTVIIRHRSKKSCTTSPRDDKTPIDGQARHMATLADSLAHLILAEVLKLPQTLKVGDQLTLNFSEKDYPAQNADGYQTVTRRDVMFSLLILGPIYRYRADSYDEASFTFTFLPRISWKDLEPATW